MISIETELSPLLHYKDRNAFFLRNSSNHMCASHVMTFGVFCQCEGWSELIHFYFSEISAKNLRDKLFFLNSHIKLLFSCSELFPSPIPTSSLCQVKRTNTRKHAHKGWDGWILQVLLQSSSSIEVRWLILPHFPSGPIWDTICLALIMTEPSPISPSLWDIAQPVHVLCVCEFELKQMKNELSSNLTRRIWRHCSVCGVCVD